MLERDEENGYVYLNDYRYPLDLWDELRAQHGQTDEELAKELEKLQ